VKGCAAVGHVKTESFPAPSALTYPSPTDRLPRVWPVRSRITPQCAEFSV
jgi:hypothetical protein